MTTDNIIPVVRDVNILLSLDTYQGMSDEEIDSIIEFKKQMSYNEGYNTAVEERANDAYTSILEMYGKLCEDTRAEMERIHASTPQFITLDFGGEV